MATEKETGQETLIPETPAPKTTKKPKAVTPTYSIEDIASRARAQHGVPPEVVTVALRMAGKDQYTADEAKKLIKEFLTKEVT